MSDPLALITDGLLSNNTGGSGSSYPVPTLTVGIEGKDSLQTTFNPVVKVEVKTKKLITGTDPILYSFFVKE